MRPFGNIPACTKPLSDGSALLLVNLGSAVRAPTVAP